MKHIVVKAVLLYTTSLLIILFLGGGCESLIENGYTIISLLWVALNAFLLYLCMKYISYKELCKLSGVDLIDNVLYNK